VKRHTLFFSLAIAAALVLSACTITVEPGPPPPRQPSDTRTAANNDAAPVNTYNLAPGADVFIRVNVDTTRPVLYLELNRNFDLEVFNSSRNRIASASSSAFFGSGTLGLSTAAELDSQALNTNVACRGSCVILDQGTSDHYFVLITNTSGSAQSVGLFAFGDFFADAGEPNNDTMAAAPTIDLFSGDSGALEVLGDVDYWRVPAAAGAGVVLRFDGNSAVDATLRVVNSAGTTVGGPIINGDFLVRSGEFIEVASSTSRAAASAASLYSISRP